MEPKTVCTKCGVSILVDTASKHGGLCRPCANGTRTQIDAARARALEPKPARPPAISVAPSAAAIIDTLESINDPESLIDLAKLEGALIALPLAKDKLLCIPALLRVFERFPWSDGFESFWGILHSLETLSGYEPELVASVRRAPGEFNLLMIKRLLNGGVYEVEGQSLLGLLGEIVNADQYSSTAKAKAETFLNYQSKLS